MLKESYRQPFFMETLFSDGGILDELTLRAKLHLTSEQVPEVLERMLSEGAIQLLPGNYCYAS